MNCENCGAPLKLVNDRDYFVCNYCGSYAIPDTNRDGVRRLGDSTQLTCPVCRNELVTASVGGQRVLQCANCKGVLFDQRDFARVIEHLHLQPVQLGTLPRPANLEELGRPLHCPKCHQRMDTHFYGGTGRVVIDNCYDCRVIWLDYGELNHISVARTSELR